MKDLLIIFFTLLCCSCSQGQKQPDMKMHRVQDSTNQTTEGWYYAKSTEGHFAVLMPIPFNDFTLTTQDPNIGQVQLYGIGAKSREGIKLSLTEMPYTKKSKDVNFDDMADSFKDAQVTDIDKTPYKGYSALSFSVHSKNSSAFIKYIKTNTGLLNITVESPFTYENEAEAIAEKIYQSLEIF